MSDRMVQKIFKAVAWFGLMVIFVLSVELIEINTLLIARSKVFYYLFVLSVGVIIEMLSDLLSKHYFKY